MAQGIPVDVSPEDNPTKPEPDLVVLTRSFLETPPPRPKPSDSTLLVEVADTTLSFDLGPKAALYARAEIVDYWVLDVTGHRLIVHRRPSDGQYRDVMAYAEAESVAPHAAAGIRVLVGDLL